MGYTIISSVHGIRVGRFVAHENIILLVPYADLAANSAWGRSIILTLISFTIVVFASLFSK